jgi:drug/metabolite transporter (DMT)-like permease
MELSPTRPLLLPESAAYDVPRNSGELSADINQAASSSIINRDELFGLAWMALSALCFSSMSLLVNIGGTQEAYRLPSLQMVFARSLIQAILAAIYLWCQPNSGVFGPNDPKVRRFLVLRGATGSLGLAAFFIALTSMPLADATVIFFTGPPMTAVLAYWVLGESLSKLDISAVVFCFLGVGLVSRPQFIFHDDNFALKDRFTSTRALGVAAALLGAAMSAIAYLLVRYISTRLSQNVKAMVHVFYFGVISSAVSLVAMFTLQRPIWPHTTQQWMLLLSVGASKRQSNRSCRDWY